MCTGLLFITGSEQIGIDRIRNACYGVSGEQCTAFGFLFKPMATGYKCDRSSFIKFFFLSEYAGGQVFFIASAIKEGTMVTFMLVIGTFACMVTNTGRRPHIMHSPYNRFPRFQYFAEIFE